MGIAALMDEFHVLGSLSVRTAEGVEIPLPGPRQRALLARLLMEAGVTVAADTLIDSAWNRERLPHDARAALQVQVSRLRRALSPLGVRLITSPPGYRLELESAQLDVSTFEACLKLARTLARDSATGSLAAYDRALSLWSGRAFAEFADSFAREESARLEQLRYAAMEERAEVLIELGETALAVEAAEALINADELRERPYALAMRALVDSGRANEALTLYARLRRRTVEELGTEPGRDIQDLHVALLRQEASVERSLSAAPVGEGLVPSKVSAADPERRSTPPHRPWARRPTLSFQRGDLGIRPLPVAVDTFVGRDADVAAVDKVAAAHRLVTLVGPGGVGKTRLAAEWARSMGDDVRVAWVELAALREPEAVPTAFLDAIGVSTPPRVAVSGSPLGGTLESLVTALAPQRITLVVDNCEHVVDEVSMTVSAVLGRCPGVRIVATSRQRLHVGGEHVFLVAPLAISSARGGSVSRAVPGSALELFVDRTRAAGHPLNLDDPDTARLVEAVCRRVDGLPLAVELLAAQTANLGLTEVAGAARLLDLADSGRPGRGDRRSLRAALSWSYERLSTEEKALLNRLTVFPGWFSPADATAVCGDASIPPRDIPLLLSSLIDKSLVVRRFGAGAESQHGLLEVVRAYLKEPPACQEVAHFAGVHARHVVERLERLCVAVDSIEDAGISAILNAMPDIRAARRWARRHDVHLAMQLVGSLCWYLELRGDDEVRRWAELDMEQPGAEHHRLFPVVLAMAASGAAARGDLGRAELLSARSVAAVDSDEPLSAYALLQRSSVSLVRGDILGAARGCVSGWRIARRAVARMAEVATAGGAAVALAYLGDPRSGRWLARCLGTARGQAAMVRATADLFAGECQVVPAPGPALTLLQHCHTTASGLGAHALAGLALTGIVTVQGRRSEDTDVFRAYLDVLRHWQSNGDELRLWLTLRNLIPVLSRHGKDESAVALHIAVDSSTGYRAHRQELDILAPAVSHSIKAVGQSMPRLTLQWRGAGVAAAVDLATSTIEEILDT